MMRRLFTGLRHAISLHLRPLDRLLLVILASKTRSWRSALLLVQPDTLLRWHREGVRLVWKVRSRAATRTPRVPAEAIALIVEMARENRLWGAARIRANPRGTPHAGHPRE